MGSGGAAPISIVNKSAKQTYMEIGVNKGKLAHQI